MILQPRLGVFVLPLAAAVMLAACGSAASSAPGATPSSQATAETATATPAATPEATPAPTAAPSPSPAPAACVQAIADAAAIDDDRDQVTDLDPAIQACPSFEVFVTVAAQYPTALDGADPATFVGNRCADATVDLAATAICAEDGG